MQKRMTKSDYLKYRNETAKNMKSFKDIYGKPMIQCSECTKEKCETRHKKGQCSKGKLKPELKKYL